MVGATTRSAFDPGLLGALARKLFVSQRLKVRLYYRRKTRIQFVYSVFLGFLAKLCEIVYVVLNGRKIKFNGLPVILAAF